MRRRGFLGMLAAAAAIPAAKAIEKASNASDAIDKAIESAERKRIQCLIDNSMDETITFRGTPIAWVSKLDSGKQEDISNLRDSKAQDLANHFEDRIWGEAPIRRDIHRMRYKGPRDRFAHQQYILTTRRQRLQGIEDPRLIDAHFPYSQKIEDCNLYR